MLKCHHRQQSVSITLLHIHHRQQSVYITLDTLHCQLKWDHWSQHRLFLVRKSNVLNNRLFYCHVMLYNTCHVMLYNMCNVLCYKTCVMLC